MKRSLEISTRPSRIEHWRHLVEIIAFAGAAVWAVYVFLYQERIKPATAPPRLQPEFHVTSAALSNRRTFVKITATLKNRGESNLALAGIIMNAYGIRYADRESSFDLAPASGISIAGHALAPQKEQLAQSFVNRWRPFGTDKGLTIETNQSFDESFGFAVPAGRYDAIAVRWSVCWVREGERRRYDVATTKRKDGSYAFGDESYRFADEPSGLTCRFQRRGDPFPLSEGHAAPGDG